MGRSGQVTERVYPRVQVPHAERLLVAVDEPYPSGGGLRLEEVAEGDGAVAGEDDVTLREVLGVRDDLLGREALLDGRPLVRVGVGEVV